MPVMFWWGNVNGRHHLEDLPVDEKILLKFVLNK
jgi:hypothetical protein